MNRIHLLLIMFFAISCQKPKESKITLAVAANMQYAMEALATKFEEMYAIPVEISSSSSGILTTQIRQGAPFDIFMSANMNYPSTLYDEGLATSPPKIYAYGVLILWTMKDSIDLKSGLDVLLQNNVENVAIANSETAPYGIAALEAIRNVSLYESIKEKLVIGESIGQVNQYIQMKAVDIGITSKSVLYSSNVTIKGRSSIIDKKLYEPINQGIVVLKHGDKKNHKNTRLFYDFMFSDEARAILFNYGYEIN